ncbi:hypothetical protein MRB53_038041 [Persea americana]|nr:hypothetical protein MRB53_038041 [Persea americana]
MHMHDTPHKPIQPRGPLLAALEPRIQPRAPPGMTRTRAPGQMNSFEASKAKVTSRAGGRGWRVVVVVEDEGVGGEGGGCMRGDDAGGRADAGDVDDGVGADGQGVEARLVEAHGERAHRGGRDGGQHHALADAGQDGGRVGFGTRARLFPGVSGTRASVPTWSGRSVWTGRRRLRMLVRRTGRHSGAGRGKYVAARGAAAQAPGKEREVGMRESDLRRAERSSESSESSWWSVAEKGPTNRRSPTETRPTRRWPETMRPPDLGGLAVDVLDVEDDLRAFERGCAMVGEGELVQEGMQRADPCAVHGAGQDDGHGPRLGR